MVFQPGQSGNPAGKPKGSISITALVKKALLEKPEGEKDKTYIQQFVEKLLDKAIKDGDSQTQKMIWNYIDGLPKETIDHTLTITKPLASIDDLRKNDSNPQDSKLNEKDTSNTGRDSSEQDD